MCWHVIAPPFSGSGEGCPGLDVAYFMQGSLTIDMREKYEPALLRLYHRTLARLRILLN